MDFIGLNVAVGIHPTKSTSNKDNLPDFLLQSVPATTVVYLGVSF